MARPKKGKSRSGGEGAPILAILLFGFVALSGGALGYYYLTTERPPELDRTSLCPVDGPRAVTAVLVDATDDLPDASKRQVTAIVSDAAVSLAPHEMLDIRVIDVSGSRSVFTRCNPGDGAGLSEWTANPALARRRWEEGFRRPTELAIAASMASARAKTSPIMKAIQDTALERFTSSQSDIASRKLIIISDMLENDPDYSHYSGDLSFQRYRKSVAYRKYSTDLNDAEVSIRMVQRLSRKPADDLALVKFWRDWISDNKGRFQEVTRLQGAG